MSLWGSISSAFKSVLAESWTQNREETSPGASGLGISGDNALHSPHSLRPSPAPHSKSHQSSPLCNGNSSIHSNNQQEVLHGSSTPSPNELSLSSSPLTSSFVVVPPVKKLKISPQFWTSADVLPLRKHMATALYFSTTSAELPRASSISSKALKSSVGALRTASAKELPLAHKVPGSSQLQRSEPMEDDDSSDDDPASQIRPQETPVPSSISFPSRANTDSTTNGKGSESDNNEPTPMDDEEDALCQAFDRSLRQFSKSELVKQRNDSLRNEIQRVYRNTEEVYGCLRAEADRHLKTLQQFDPRGYTVLACRERIHQASQLMQQKVPLHEHRNSYWRSRLASLNSNNNTPSPRSTGASSSGAARRPHEVDLAEVLRKAKIRFLHVKQSLMEAISMLLPAIEDCERRHILVNNRSLTCHILSFLAIDDLCQSALVCRNWKRIIDGNRLFSSSIASSQERWRFWRFCINKRPLHVNLKVTPLTGPRSAKGDQQFNYQVLVQASHDSPLVDHELIEKDVRRTTFFDPRALYSSSVTTNPVPGPTTCIQNGRVLPVPDAATNGSLHMVARINELQQMLARLLKAFALYDTSVGYCQGMTFLGAMLLSCLCYDEARAFQVFVALMHRYEMNDMFRKGLPGCQLRCFQLHQLIRVHLPDLFVCLDRHQILPMMYATGWMMTLFSNDTSLPPVIVVKILDLFLDQSWPGLLRVQLGLLSAFKTSIKVSRYEKALQALTKLSKLFALEKEETLVFEKAMSFQLDAEQLQRLARDFRQHSKS